MKNSKNTARMISKISLEIATSIKNTATAALHGGDATELPISVAAALGVTKESVVRSSTCVFDLTKFLLQCLSTMCDLHVRRV